MKRACKNIYIQEDDYKREFYVTKILNYKHMNKVIWFLIFSMIILLLNCGGITDKELHESAQQNIKEKNYPEAIVDLQKLIAEFPESEYCAEAFLEIGKMYHGKVIKNLSAEESNRKAIHYYKQLHDKYPNDPYAAQAFFMVGFIQANELGQLDSAKISYTQFLNDYPDNEMAESAQAELDNLGLPAEEVLRKKIVESD